MSAFTTSRWLHTGMHQPMPYIGNSGPGAGMVRFNTANQSIEVFDGVNWHGLGPVLQEISTTSEADRLFAWASKKMQEEIEIEQLAQQHPTVKAAYEDYKESLSQLKTVIILCKEQI